MKSSQLFTLALICTPLFAASPAEIAIRQAVASIEKQPAHYRYYNDLAAAYTRRARETADDRWYGQAEESMGKSLALSPDNFEALKVKAAIQLGRHEFAEALETATHLNKTAPDDVAVYGYLVDADLALGNYDDAVAAAQWMLNLREGSGPGLTYAANLRRLYGNFEGALELLRKAYDVVAPSETEEQARLLTLMAQAELEGGRLQQAEADADAALAAFPDYDSALDQLARVRLAQGRYAEAATLLHKRYDAVPRTVVLYQLAEAQELAGQQDASAASFREFEKHALASGNANRELALYYLDHAGEPAKALAIAQREAVKYHDAGTLDVYAWALAGNGDYTKAGDEMQKALASGIKDPTLLHHADWIAQHGHQR